MIRNTLINIRHLIIFLLDTICSFLIPVKSEKNTSKKILVVRMDAIGDFILWLDAARAIREKYPDYQITILGNRLWHSLAEKLPYFDKVITISPKELRGKLSYRYRFFKELRQENYNLVIHPAYTREGWFLDAEAIVRFATSTEKVGFQNNPGSRWRIKFSDHFYTKLVPDSGHPMMELERNAELVRFLGKENFIAGIPLIPENTFNDSKPLLDYHYVLFPGTSSFKKQWSTKSFAEIADRIYENTGWKGIICGGPGEEQLGIEINNYTKAPLKNLIGTTSLPELVELIRKAKILIGNDTGAIHIAASVATPSICILGGGHFGRFLPYSVKENTKLASPTAVFHKMSCFNCYWNCIYESAAGKPVPCIAENTVDSVWQEIYNKLQLLNVIRNDEKVNC